MKNVKQMAGTANKSVKKTAMVMAMAAIAQVSIGEECAAARAAKQAMMDEFGSENVYPVLEYTYDPFDGMWA